ncbi:uncharacterized protein LOC114845166 isoform X2 [Betta splendens]|uniref:Uncharacterized protein LOC114845166 isoform X2 n=1 Tax=Betta splendens TaxID=158456 RepID=A0A9W2XD00_BETSP|nr:uncharacterized protein LOC114845166 isoform X2 [Betta splendens]
MDHRFQGVILPFLSYHIQVTDCGTSTVSIIQGKQYNVTVQVSPVDLTVDSLSNSSHTFNLTVTCRTQDSHISTTFTCVNQTCSEDGDRSKATTSASRGLTSVFVKKGSDLQLDVKEDDVDAGFSLILWTVNEEDLVRYSPGGTPYLYSERVEFSETNYTLTLKHVKETDSGNYTAEATKAKKKIVAKYKVTVQAPVSPISLTVDSASSSSDSCNLTVTCRTQNSHISTTFTCVNQTCSEDGDRAKATTSGAVLHVYIENDSIKCNHSNQVSWTTSQGAKIQDFCHQPSGTLSAGFPLCLVKMVVFSVGLIIMTSAVITVNLMERTMKRNLTRPKESSTSVITHTSH